MKIYKSINNNIVSAYDEDQREVVVIGKGIGFKAYEGAEIPKEKIEKVFVMSSPDNMERLKDLFATLPSEYIELTDEIIQYATRYLNIRLNERVYLTLADHINFAVTRMKQGMEFSNVLFSDVRRFYPQEFDIGMYALKLMEERLGIVMPEDEAASIALHIFNAEYDISMSDAYHSTKLINHMIEIIYKEIGYSINEQNDSNERLYTHLKFLTQRIVKKKNLPNEDDEFFKLLASQYPKEMQCSQNVADYIKKEYEYELSQEEISNLAIHMRRIQKRNQ